MLTPSVTRRGGSNKPHEYENLVRQVTESEVFRTAPVMRALLSYLWSHQGQSISEYAIATEALGRSAAFDPKCDSTVRVQIARLRSKLKEFYDVAGDSCPLRLSVPLGGHELQWTYQAPVRSFGSRFDGIPKNYLWAVGIGGGALIFVCAALAVYVHLLRVSLPSPPPPLPRFWQSFLVGGKSTEIVVPSPTYFYWPAHKVYVRDLGVSEFTQWDSSSFLKSTAKKWGPPELAQIYVGALEMTAGVDLLQYLEQKAQPVALTESRRFPAESFAAQNTIFLGMPRTATYLNQILDKTNFYIASVNPDVIRSRNPGPGEPAEYREVDYSSDRRIAPAIIIMLPMRPEHTRTLLLLGRYLTTMSTMLITQEGLRLIDEQWQKAGSPDAWEMIVQGEISRDTVLKLYALKCRPISSNFWK